MKSFRANLLGIRLSDEENNFLLALAETKGIQKSTYARSILRQHFIQNGLHVHNPMPQTTEETTL